MTSASLSEFEHRVVIDWLPSFCDAPHRIYSTLDFKKESIQNPTKHDATWFLRSIDLEYFLQVFIMVKSKNIGCIEIRPLVEK